jgi:hypothetical protein
LFALSLYQRDTFSFNSFESHPTSIDYTLCDQNDKPILCIEFDGLQQGVNIGTDYYASQLSHPNPWRQEIMELKLKVAYGSVFPYFVVASKHFENISPDIALTIIDGIIGTVMANRAKSERFSKGLNLAELGVSTEEFDSYTPDVRDELIQDWAIGVEVEAEMENNPITQERWKLKKALGITSYSIQFVEYPSADNAATVKERQVLIETAIMNGATITIHTNDGGDVSATAWLPNFKAVGFSHYSLTEDIAFILAAEKLKQKRRNS